jgi:hypothetical protein
MGRSSAAAPPSPPPLPKQPVKRLDVDLLNVLRKRKLDAGILPGLPFN